MRNKKSIYKSSTNEALLVPNLQALIAEGRTHLFNVQDKKQERTLSITRRQDVYGDLKPKSTVKKAIHWREVICGQRIIAMDPEATDHNYISACHTSFTQQVTNFNGLIGVVGTAPEYSSNVPVLALPALESKRDAMVESNQDANSTTAYWSTSMIVRNKFFNEEYTGYVDTFAAVKRAVKATFGNSSPEYKQMSALSFKRIYE